MRASTTRSRANKNALAWACVLGCAGVNKSNRASNGWHSSELLDATMLRNHLAGAAPAPRQSEYAAQVRPMPSPPQTYPNAVNGSIARGAKAHGSPFRASWYGVVCSSLRVAGRHFMQELTGAVEIATAIPGAKRHKFVAFGQCHKLVRFRTSISSSCTKWWATSCAGPDPEHLNGMLLVVTSSS